ncbi:MAG: sigma 54-interacting transcriptional regulator [Bacteroidota bacterium]
MKKPTQQWMVDDFLSVFNFIDQPTFLFTKDYDVRYVNRALADMLNLTHPEIAMTHIGEQLNNANHSLLKNFWIDQETHAELENIFTDDNYIVQLMKVSDNYAIGVFRVRSETVNRLQKDYSYLLREANNSHNFRQIISGNEQYINMLKQLVKVADTDTTVLIHGETGTGKELLARAVYNMSSRNDRPLVKFNCASVASDMVERELFGFEAGAFVGAHDRQLGLFELAIGGTLFLDEIAELPLPVQSKLLNVLQEGQFKRVGGSKTIQTDIRIIASTNRNMEQMIADGDFRKDLFFRLNVFPLYNPPLRERRSDIPLLVNHFRKKYAARAGKRINRVSDKEIRQLMFYDFPGNVRELENMIERAVILTDDKKLNLAAVVPELIFDQEEEDQNNRFSTFEEMQRQHILLALEKAQWRVSGKYSASTLLDLNPKTLASKMRKLKINRKDFLDDQRIT